jgi:hypothetical protein
MKACLQWIILAENGPVTLGTKRLRYVSLIIASHRRTVDQGMKPDYVVRQNVCLIKAIAKGTLGSSTEGRQG